MVPSCADDVGRLRMNSPEGEKQRRSTLCKWLTSIGTFSLLAPLWTSGYRSLILGFRTTVASNPARSRQTCRNQRTMFLFQYPLMYDVSVQYEEGVPLDRPAVRGKSFEFMRTIRCIPTHATPPLFFLGLRMFSARWLTINP